MPESRGNWGAGFIAGLGPKVMEAENQADMSYSLQINSALGIEENKRTKLFRDKATTQARETMIKKTGVGRFIETTESEDYNTDSRVAGYQTQWNPIKKTNSIEVTEELSEDQDQDVASAMDEVSDLKIGYMITQDEDAFSAFNYGFTAQASLPNHLSFYADGKPVFSVGHPIKETTTSNSTQSNANANGIVLSELNLETGRTALRRQNDDKDLAMNVGSGKSMLVVPDSMEKTAMIIAKSVLRSNTANNDMNIYDGIVTVISSKLLNSQQTSGSDTAWFLIDSLHSPFIFMTRRSYRSSVWEDNKSHNIVYDASGRYQVGNSDFRGAWGSKGDGSAYSG